MNQMKLLIVDNERMTRESLTRYIDWGTLGISEVRTADNGVQAIDICASFTPDILLCNIKMPKMDGITFCKRLREFNDACDIIFLSGYPDKENLKAALHIRALDFLEKPLNIVDVTETVRNVITRRARNNPEGISDLTAQQNENPAENPNEVSHDGKRSAKITEIEKYIQEHYHDNTLSARTISKIFYLSENYFCTYFKRKTGQTPNEYIAKVRVEQAKRLLMNHMYKLYEIASLVGFNDAEYFTFVFKRRVGCTPSVYRERGGDI